MIRKRLPLILSEMRTGISCTAWALVACATLLASPSSATTIIVDNNNGNNVPGDTFFFTGTWASATTTTGGLFYGNDFLTHRGSQGSATAKWQPTIAAAGYHEVFVRHTTGSSRTTAAQFIVDYDGGSQTVLVNQSTNGGQWISIGTFLFAAGTAGAVRLNPDTGALIFTVADAAKWESAPLPTPTKVSTWGKLKSFYR